MLKIPLIAILNSKNRLTGNELNDNVIFGNKSSRESLIKRLSFMWSFILNFSILVEFEYLLNSILVNVLMSILIGMLIILLKS